VAEKIIQTGDWAWLDHVLSRLDMEALKSSAAVTFDDVHSAFLAFMGEDDGEAEGDLLHVISAFDCPRIVFDPVRKAFVKSRAPTEMFAGAESKSRYALPPGHADAPPSGAACPGRRTFLARS